MHARTLAVFGSSEPGEDSLAYETARTVGGLLARAGFRVLTGGYGGVMEAASRGAVEAGGVAVGFVSQALFPERRPNRYLSEAVETPNLYERTRMLIEAADGYVILPGKSGTLAELTLVWALIRAGGLDPRPVVLLGSPWRRLIELLSAEGMLDGHERRVSHVVDGPEDAVRYLSGFWR